MGFELHEVEEGSVTLPGRAGRAPLQPDERGPRGPGADDHRLGDRRVGSHHTLPQGKLYGSLETKVNMVRQIGPETGPLLAKGQCDPPRLGLWPLRRRSWSAKTDGKLYAHGTSTCLILG